MSNLVKDSKLTTITEENFGEIVGKIVKFVGVTSFIQTHDWILCPLGERKEYSELTFNYPKYRFNESTAVHVHQKKIYIKSENACDAFCSQLCEESCGESLQLATIGDQIEIQDDFINVVAHSFFEDLDDDDLVVWQLYR